MSRGATSKSAQYNMTPTQHNFLSDYCYRFSNDECHRDFHFWSAITLAGALLGQRVWIAHGRFRAIPVLFTVLVGTAGSGKSSAKDVVKELMRDLFPDYTLSDSIQSREDIINQMATPEGLRAWKNIAANKIEEYRPFFLLVNELSAFLSVDHKKMIAFLIDAFDAKEISAGFKKDRVIGGSNMVRHPHLPMLACVQPKWFMSDMKMDIFERGLGRRMCIVFRDKAKLNHDPKVPIDSHEGWARVIKHIKHLYQDSVQGEIPLDQEAKKWFEAYYYDQDRRKKSDDPIISEFQETEHMVLLRVALILSFCDYDFKMTIQVQHLEIAKALLDGLKPDIIRLTGGIGTNPMAGVIQQMLLYIQVNGGKVKEKKLRLNFWKQCPRGTIDYEDGLATMQKQGLVHGCERPGLIEGMPVLWIYTAEQWKKEEAM